MDGILLTREEKGAVLEHMEVHPTVPRHAQTAFLRAALDSAQYGFRVRPTFNLTALPEWPKPTPSLAQARRIQHYTRQLNDAHADEDPTSLAQAVERGPRKLSRDIYLCASKHSPRFSPAAATNPAISTRMALLEIAKLTDCGAPWIVLDSSKGWMVRIRVSLDVQVVSVRKAHDRGPVFVLLYRVFGRHDAVVTEDSAWTIAQERKALLPPEPSTENRFSVHPTAMKLLLKLLRMNAAVVPADFPLQREATDEGYALSALQPMGHLDHRSLVWIEQRLSCEVCGRKPVKECTQCSLVAYCCKESSAATPGYPECQRKDWAVHRGRPLGYHSGANLLDRAFALWVVATHYRLH
ncbi:uncharacterized protein BXZ73DRAFT_79161 [Epithele typhae]|uniref:uncharacterized protein n=1 Tax=Epithele typhae TaxID=378194 RepID=UPI0020075AA8|nr:uncharacterized protein BXZ73DRAFT_79161 [Epithele typhae]KAH9925058.1 hypothetical protein BXZ73DRAFT_79161 [Epithele typhae]